MSPEHEQFLTSIRTFAAKFEGVSLGDVERRFNLSFWSYEQIQGSLQLRNEWDVPETLIPFYGDWHDLMCLDTEIGQVVLLDDSRRVVFVWSSTEEFLASFVASVGRTADSTERAPHIVSMQLSKDLDQRIRALVRSRKN